MPPLDQESNLHEYQYDIYKVQNDKKYIYVLDVFCLQDMECLENVHESIVLELYCFILYYAVINIHKNKNKTRNYLYFFVSLSL